MRLPTRRLTLAGFAAAAVFAALPLGCNDSNTVSGPGPMATINVSGTWTGNFQSNVCSAPAARATLQQTGAAVSGTFTASSCGIAGAFRGRVEGDMLLGSIEMAGCTGGAVTGTMRGSQLSLAIGEFTKDLINEDQEVYPGGAATLQR
jgi:hypothetical protein